MVALTPNAGLHHRLKRKVPVSSFWLPLSRTLPFLVTALTGVLLVMRNSPALINGLGFPSTYTTSYDLARLLNVSAIFDPRLTTKRATALSFPNTLAYRYATAASLPSASPDSSQHQQRHCSVRPFPSHLHRLFANYTPSLTGPNPTSVHDKQNFESDYKLAIRPDVVTVQVCLGDCDKMPDDDDYYDDHFVHRVRIYSRGFRTALIVPSFTSYSSSSSSPSSPSYYQTDDQIRQHPLVQRVATSLRMRRRLPVVIASPQTFKHADSRVAIMHAAQHPILHRGNEAVLAALAICGRPINGTVRAHVPFDRKDKATNSSKFVYSPEAFSGGFYATEAFRSYLKTDYILHTVYHCIRATKRPRQDIEILTDGMGRVHESCCSFVPYGDGDGAKILCAEALGRGVERGISRKVDHEGMLDVRTSLVSNDASGTMSGPNSTAPVDCWVLSIGCGGRWGFEADIARRTTCAVHVFDCTGNFTVPPEMANRVRHDKLCVGPKGADRSLGFRTWPELLDIGATQAGLKKKTPPLAVKMDVEGWEFPVLYALAKEVADQSALPRQLVMEVHTYTHHPVGSPFKLGLFKPGRYGVDTQDVADLFGNLSSIGYTVVHRADNPYCGHCSEVTMLHRDAFPPIV